MKIYDLPVGARIREMLSGVDFLIAEKDRETHNTVVLITDKVIAQGCLDAPEPENPDERIRITGNNCYSLSNLHQWLNASGSSWYSPTHKYDAPPSEKYLSLRPTIFDPVDHNAYVCRPGFLSWFGSTFLNALKVSDVPCLMGDGYTIQHIKAKFYLPSAAEAGVKLYDIPAEGHMFPIMEDFRMRFAAVSADSMMSNGWQPAYFKPGCLVWYWLRTPKANDSGFCYFIDGASAHSYKFACCPWMGIRPCCTVDGNLNVIRSFNIPELYLAGGEADL